MHEAFGVRAGQDFSYHLNTPIVQPEQTAIFEQYQKYQSVLERFGVETLPLVNALPYEYSLSPSIKAVADHEAQHGIVAYVEGYASSIVGIRTRPDGNALGWLQTNGDIPSPVFRKIAAGGMNNTVSGAAEGYSGDVRQLRVSAMRDRLNPDAAVAAAKSSAGASISTFTRNELDEIGNALGFMGYTTGEEFQLVILRAKILAACKDENIDVSVVAQSSVDEKQLQAYYEARAKYATLSDLPSDASIIITGPQQDIIYVEGKVYCPECDSVGSHKPNCSQITDTISAVKMDLPRMATIFPSD